MSVCTRCGAPFSCAMADGAADPCWCTSMPPVVAVPPIGAAVGCWCPACLKAYIEQQPSATPGEPQR